MKIYQVPAENGYYKVGMASEVEYVNPIEYFSNEYIQYFSSATKDILLLKKVNVPIHEIDDFTLKRAKNDWEKTYQEIIETEIPPNFLRLLECDSKREQVKLLKNQVLTPMILLGFIFKAWIDFEYVFSQYIAHHHHKGAEISQIPRLIELQKDKVVKVGKTKLTDGQLRNIVEHRKVIVSKFFDKGNNWHCFFTTFRSLNRGENWKSGQPHYHYISDKFGLKRDEVVKELKTDDYNLGNLPHIELHGYRDSE